MAPSGSSRKRRSTRNSGTNMVIRSRFDSSPRATSRTQSSKESRLMARTVRPAGESAVSTPKNFSFGLTRLMITRAIFSNPSIMVARCALRVAGNTQLAAWQLFFQLDEHAVSRRGMQERHAASVRARNGRLVDQEEARFFEARQVRF